MNHRVDNVSNTILIVDDSPENLRLLRGVLAGADYGVRTATNGPAALKSAQLKSPDLILLDVMMPDMNGYEVCERLKADVATRDIPVIFISAAREAHDKVRSFEAGGVDYIEKPFQAQEVLARVKTHLTLRRMQQNLEGLVKERTGALEHAYEELCESEAKHQRLVDNLAGAFLYRHDTKGVFEYVSSSVTGVLGYTTAEFLTHYEEYLSHHPINREAVRHTELSLQGISQHPYEVEVRHKHGGVRWLEVSEIPVRNEGGEVVAVEGVAHDITERKQLESQLRQAQKMEAIGTLAGGIAHDFNNILGAITGYVALALDEEYSPGSETPGWLRQAQKALERAAALVDQILTFSRRGEQEAKPVSLNVLVKEVLRLLRASIPTTIEIQSAIPAASVTVCADPTQIHQVIMNLCANASYAMAGTAGRLTVTLKQEELGQERAQGPLFALAPGPYARLTVADTGPGMDAETMERIFEPFFTTKPKGEGTGMGLAVLHGIVGAHGGAVTVSSEQGQGTSFDVYLPIIEEAGGADPNEQGPLSAPRGSGQRILLVDDDEDIVRVYRTWLERLGYVVVVRRDGVEGLESFSARPDSFDLIITDQTMPRLTGTELAQSAIRLRPDIPVILCSGYSGHVSAGGIEQAGIRVFLKKPIEREKMAEAVARLLNA